MIGGVGTHHREGMYGLVYTYGVYAWGGGVMDGVFSAPTIG